MSNPITEITIGLIAIQVMRDIRGCTPDIALMATRSALHNHYTDEPTALSVIAITAEALGNAETILQNGGFIVAAQPPTTTDEEDP